MSIAAIRGAITVDQNDGPKIERAAVILLEEIINRNRISVNDIVFILFTCTDDLDEAYPAAGLRKAGYTGAPLLCAAEMKVKGSIEKCIRVMVLVNVDVNQRVRHVYIGEAKNLRPDLSEE
jgi:chorismate mutase